MHTLIQEKSQELLHKSKSNLLHEDVKKLTQLINAQSMRIDSLIYTGEISIEVAEKIGALIPDVPKDYIEEMSDLPSFLKKQNS